MPNEETEPNSDAGNWSDADDDMVDEEPECKKEATRPRPHFFRAPSDAIPIRKIIEKVHLGQRCGLRVYVQD